MAGQSRTSVSQSVSQSVGNRCIGLGWARPDMPSRMAFRWHPAPSTLHPPSCRRPGFCEVTSDSLGVGDCDEGSMGSVRVGHPDFGMITSLDKCASWCLHFCSRCNYVSFSLAANDCSWYATQHPAPQHPAPGTRHPAPSTRAEGWVLCRDSCAMYHVPRTLHPVPRESSAAGTTAATSTSSTKDGKRLPITPRGRSRRSAALQVSE